MMNDEQEGSGFILHHSSFLIYFFGLASKGCVGSGVGVGAVLPSGATGRRMPKLFGFSSMRRARKFSILASSRARAWRAASTTASSPPSGLSGRPSARTPPRRSSDSPGRAPRPSTTPSTSSNSRTGRTTCSSRGSPAISVRCSKFSYRTLFWPRDGSRPPSQVPAMYLPIRRVSLKLKTAIRGLRIDRCGWDHGDDRVATTTELDEASEDGAGRHLVLGTADGDDEAARALDRGGHRPPALTAGAGAVVAASPSGRHVTGSTHPGHRGDGPRPRRCPKQYPRGQGTCVMDECDDGSCSNECTVVTATCTGP